MKNFVAIICCLTSQYHKLISPDLVSLGYTVSAGSSTGEISVNNESTAVISYILSHKTKNVGSDILDDVKKCLKDNKVYYYNCVVFENVGSASWQIGNIEYESDPIRVLKLKSLW